MTHRQACAEGFLRALYSFGRDPKRHPITYCAFLNLCDMADGF